MCLYPHVVPVAVEALAGTTVAVASVAGGFPSGLGPLETRLAEIRAVVAMGADEVDIVLNRSLFLGGRYAEAFEELVAAREAAGQARLKVILETGELGSYDRVRQASALAMAAGADFIKTSTGKIGTNATLPVALCMMEAARDFHAQTGRARGRQGGGRRAEVEAGGAVSGAGPRDAGAAMAHARALPDRRVLAPERRAHATRQRERPGTTRAPTTSRSTDEGSNEA